MARKFYRTEIINEDAALTVNLGSVSDYYRDTEIGKFVKMGTLDSQYVLCALGDMIDGSIVSIDAATSAGFTVGSIDRESARFAVADGSQAAGTGALAIGDYVVAGTPAARGTAVNGVTYAKVRKATIQPGVTVPADLAAVATHIAMIPFLWRVVSLGAAGTGAVGTTVLIERVTSPD